MMVAAETTTTTAAAAVMMPKSLRSSRRSGVGRGIMDVWRKHTSMYTVSHAIEPRDFDMFCFMSLPIALWFCMDLPLRGQLLAVFPKNIKAPWDGNRGTTC